VRRKRFEAAWDSGELFAILGVFADQGVNRASNEIVAEMIRDKIRSIVLDPETAESLCPRDYPFGTKRPCLDSGYFTFKAYAEDWRGVQVWRDVQRTVR
jgi:cation diffusion facilitator CzcD-associated flavoprotein CzcO